MSFLKFIPLSYCRYNDWLPFFFFSSWSRARSGQMNSYNRYISGSRRLLFLVSVAFPSEQSEGMTIG